ncbi:MAG: hypothetical protein HC927_02765 [Deltaproteobacteria bacterium]|nr:hypothetical protein [Deltaproteobacteria bacterium]
MLRDVLRVIEQPSLRLVPLRERTCFDDYLPQGFWDLRMPDSLRGLWAERTRALLGKLEGRGLNPLDRVLGTVPEKAGPAPIEFVHRRIDADRTAALVDACRARDNTVLSALVVACAYGLLGVDGGAAKGLVGCITPIDIRALLEPTVGDDFGIYAWAPTSYHPIAPGADFWRLAARMRRIMRVYRSMPALAGMRRFLDLVELTEGTPVAGGMEKLSRALLDGMMVVSNLGRVAVPEKVAGVEVESFGFFAMIPNVDFVLGVQSYRGVLEMNYCCSPRWRRASVIEKVADRVEAVLEAASGGRVGAGAQGLVYG